MVPPGLGAEVSRIAGRRAASGDHGEHRLTRGGWTRGRGPAVAHWWRDSPPHPIICAPHARPPRPTYPRPSYSRRRGHGVPRPGLSAPHVGSDRVALVPIAAASCAWRGGHMVRSAARVAVVVLDVAPH